MESALQYYTNIGEVDKIDELKASIGSAYEDAINHGEFKQFSSSISINVKEQEELLKPFLELSNEQALRSISIDTSLIPNISEIERQTREQDRNSPLTHFVYGSLISSGKKVYQATNEEEAFKINFGRNYITRVLIANSLAMMPLFEALVERKGLNVEDLMMHFKSWPLLDIKNSFFLDTGIRRYFDGDYVSALHILVPQLEATVRTIFKKAGFATTSIKRGMAQHEETFNEFLSREEVIASLGANYHKYLEMVMVDQTGLNLRNEIAHGLIDPLICNKGTTLMVIHLYLLLTRYSLETK